MAREIDFTFDLVDRCSLSCVSCYRGINGNQNTYLSLEQLEESLEHISRNFEIRHIIPYNWSEPFLSSDFLEALNICKKFSNAPIMMSTNLNVTLDESFLKDVLPLISTLRISASGLEQEIYQKYHRGGNIQRVLLNLDKILKIKKEMGLKLYIQWAFGKNLYNESQSVLIERYCKERQIDFWELDYYLTNIEDVYTVYQGGVIPKSSYDVLYSSYEVLQRDVQRKVKPQSCFLLEKDITINSKGELTTCCGSNISTGVPIVQVNSLEEAIDIKMKNEFCSNCYKIGLSGFYL